MWEAAFDISMLLNSKVIVSCPNKDLVAEFMNLLAENDVRWCGAEKAVPSEHRSHWSDYGEETCYWIEDGELAYANKEYAEENDGEFSGYIKCTFYGVDSPDFDVATDSELCSLLNIVGGE